MLYISKGVNSISYLYKWELSTMVDSGLYLLPVYNLWDSCNKHNILVHSQTADLEHSVSEKAGFVKTVN